jgi:hypothetical protein
MNTEKILITFYDHKTLGTVVREMTDEEHEALLASGWTLEGTDETPSAD